LITPESSRYTSLKLRIEHLEKSVTALDSGKSAYHPKALLRFKDKDTNSPHQLPVTLLEYLELVDWSGRAYSVGKRGRIEQDVPPILSRLKVTPLDWLEITDSFGKRFSWIVGNMKSFSRKHMYFGLPNTDNPKKRNILVF